jgi:hypothetical protein
MNFYAIKLTHQAGHVVGHHLAALYSCAKAVTLKNVTRSFVINSVDFHFVWNAMMEPVFLSGQGVEHRLDPAMRLCLLERPILGWYVRSKEHGNFKVTRREWRDKDLVEPSILIKMFIHKTGAVQNASVPKIRISRVKKGVRMLNRHIFMMPYKLRR